MIGPVLMSPAYRYGRQTPWGGNLLRTMYHKNIPDEATGESLEVSAIPGLNSTSPDGETLSELIERYGTDLMGTEVQTPFPLLLKLLDARDKLSVQVHPDDEYASRVENKLGKTEAWIILHAEPGAGLVYGVKEGVTKEQLYSSSIAGEGVEELLNFVPVAEGDVFYIPAGTVHAIGAGIVLYEIQQSSDVTYRFYDWNRADEHGNKRELHIDKAVDVTDLNAPRSARKPVAYDTGKEYLLREKYFTTERWKDVSSVLLPDTRRFSFITAVKDSLITWEDGRMLLRAGHTILQPANGYALDINASHILISYPTVQADA